MIHQELSKDYTTCQKPPSNHVETRKQWRKSGLNWRRVLDRKEAKGPRELKSKNIFLVSMADRLHILPIALAGCLRIILTKFPWLLFHIQFL